MMNDEWKQPLAPAPSFCIHQSALMINDNALIEQVDNATEKFGLAAFEHHCHFARQVSRLRLIASIIRDAPSSVSPPPVPTWLYSSSNSSSDHPSTASGCCARYSSTTGFVVRSNERCANVEGV